MKTGLSGEKETAAKNRVAYVQKWEQEKLNEKKNRFSQAVAAMQHLQQSESWVQTIEMASSQCWCETSVHPA